MHRRFVMWAALLGLALLPQALRAADPKDAPDARSEGPAVIVRLASIDTLVADIRRLAELAGREDEAKQIEGIVKEYAGQKGLDGIDTKKPFGLYASVTPTLVDSEVVVMVPIADEKAFVDMLNTKGLKPEKDKDDVYTVQVEKIPFPLFFRFANGYAYLTARDQTPITGKRPLAPAAVLPAGQAGTLSAVVHIDRFPDNLKNLVLQNLDNRLAKLTDKGQKPAGETEATVKARTAVTREVAGWIRSVLREGGQLDLRLDLDRNSPDLSLSVKLTGKPGTDLATNITDLGKVKSLAASLVGSNSAASAIVDVSLPARVRNALVPLVDEREEKLLDRQPDKARRELLSTILKAVNPTIKSGKADAGVDLRGPNADGLYTLVLGARIKDGKAIEKTIRRLVSEIPADQKETVKLDVEKVGDVSIHRVMPEKTDEQFRKAFGDNPFFVAVREDALLVAGGDKGLSALKEVLDASPKTGKVLQVELAMSRMAPLMTKEHKAAPEIAKKAFAKTKDADRIRITLEGGNALAFRLAMRAQLVTFFSMLDQAEKGEKGDK
jgi:hypothetical protein